MKVKDGVWWVGTLNPTLRVFDVIMQTAYGTTYNAYVVRNEKTAIIDANHAKLTDLSLAKLSEVVDFAEVDYIVAQHSEPDHTGSLAALIAKCPNAEVLCTKPAAKFLSAIAGEFPHRTVGDGEEVSLGKKTLRFLSVPFWHWPDTMMTYLPEERLLFSCDGFGAHFCDERMYDDLVEREPYLCEFAVYYDAIMRPFADKIYDGVQKIKSLDISMICPSHGPIIRDPERVISAYEEWSDAQRKVEDKVAIFYASAYGNTKAMAEALAEGARTHAKVSLVDLSGGGDWRGELESAKGILVGSCTINGDAVEPVWRLLSLFALVNRRGKKAAAFGSYGWSGEAVPMIEERLRSLRLTVTESGLKANFVPTEADLEKCRAFGAEFAKDI
ncbi:MAG: FprA family A-type flavoprotein [Armatimonadota bacterium]